MKVDIYIMLRFHGNPYGYGKAAAILEFVAKSGQKYIRTAVTAMSYGTRNALELKICNAAIKTLVKPCDIVLHINGDYVASVYRIGWLELWQRSGWCRANGKPPANLLDWKQFYVLSHMHQLSFSGAGSCFLKELERLVGEE